MRKITKIRQTAALPAQRMRVAAYARVSSGKDAMLHSLSQQVSYYNEYIQKRADWAFAGIYADEAVTGTKDTRREFQRLLNDCRTGKIDSIITKSVTRFARNTVTFLKTVRELKSLGIDVFFEKENIHSLSADGELMLTLLASFAQEESLSVSENQKWRIRRMFEQGRPNTGNMLGYNLVDGTLYIVAEEAEIVKMIFADYLCGMGVNAIMKKLNAKGILTKRGNRWNQSSVWGILRNEKYTGEMLLQKTFSSDHINKRRTVNRGELPMYHVTGSHEAIIDKETFERVQCEIRLRSEKYHPKVQTHKQYPFSGLIRCGICGKYYRRKIACAGGKYKKLVWICATYNTYGKSACPSQQIPENILIEKTAEVLGITEFDAKALEKHISEIRVPKHGSLIYIYKNEQTNEVSWQNSSRRDSWDESMRQKAREHQKVITERRRKV